MCEKRVACLKKLALKPKRPVQQVIPEPGVPLQPPGGAPHPLRLRKSQHRQVSRNTLYMSVCCREYFGGRVLKSKRSNDKHFQYTHSEYERFR